jgi:hypothetical protein
MNERIIKLSEHANDYANHLDKIGVDDGWQNIFNQKFAELIIRECAGVGYDASYYECALNVSNKIKQHFGVAE